MASHCTSPLPIMIWQEIYEFWRETLLQDVQIVKDIYPSRIDIDFELHNAEDLLLASAQRELRVAGAFGSPTLMVPHRNDQLRIEKRLTDRWVQQEFPAAR